jgi:hypothetical protein
MLFLGNNSFQKRISRERKKKIKLNVLENGGSGKTFSEKMKSILGIF